MHLESCRLICNPFTHSALTLIGFASRASFVERVPDAASHVLVPPGDRGSQDRGFPQRPLRRPGGVDYDIGFSVIFSIVVGKVELQGPATVGVLHTEIEGQKLRKRRVLVSLISMHVAHPQQRRGLPPASGPCFHFTASQKFYLVAHPFLQYPPFVAARAFSKTVEGHGRVR